MEWVNVLFSDKLENWCSVYSLKCTYLTKEWRKTKQMETVKQSWKIVYDQSHGHSKCEIARGTVVCVCSNFQKEFIYFCWNDYPRETTMCYLVCVYTGSCIHCKFVKCINNVKSFNSDAKQYILKYICLLLMEYINNRKHIII